jgi:hypothetical protein
VALAATCHGIVWRLSRDIIASAKASRMAQDYAPDFRLHNRNKGAELSSTSRSATTNSTKHSIDVLSRRPSTESMPRLSRRSQKRDRRAVYEDLFVGHPKLERFVYRIEV